MNYSFHISDEAEVDITETCKYYNAILPDLAERFLLNLDLIFGKIKSSPTSFALRHKNIRGVLIKKFPFTVFYQITGIRIEIMAIVHQNAILKYGKEEYNN